MSDESAIVFPITSTEDSHPMVNPCAMFKKDTGEDDTGSVACLFWPPGTWEHGDNARFVTCIQPEYSQLTRVFLASLAAFDPVLCGANPSKKKGAGGYLQNRPAAHLDCIFVQVPTVLPHVHPGLIAFLSTPWTMYPWSSCTQDEDEEEKEAGEEEEDNEGAEERNRQQTDDNEERRGGGNSRQEPPVQSKRQTQLEGSSFWSWFFKRGSEHLTAETTLCMLLTGLYGGAGGNTKRHRCDVYHFNTHSEPTYWLSIDTLRANLIRASDQIDHDFLRAILAFPLRYDIRELGRYFFFCRGITRAVSSRGISRLLYPPASPVPVNMNNFKSVLSKCAQWNILPLSQQYRAYHMKQGAIYPSVTSLRSFYEFVETMRVFYVNEEKLVQHNLQRKLISLVHSFGVEVPDSIHGLRPFVECARTSMTTTTQNDSSSSGPLLTFVDMVMGYSTLQNASIGVVPLWIALTCISNGFMPNCSPSLVFFGTPNNGKDHSIELGRRLLPDGVFKEASYMSSRAFISEEPGIQNRVLYSNEISPELTGIGFCNSSSSGSRFMPYATHELGNRHNPSLATADPFLLNMKAMLGAGEFSFQTNSEALKRDGCKTRVSKHITFPTHFAIVGSSNLSLCLPVSDSALTSRYIPMLTDWITRDDYSPFDQMFKTPPSQAAVRLVTQKIKGRVALANLALFQIRCQTLIAETLIWKVCCMMLKERLWKYYSYSLDPRTAVFVLCYSLALCALEAIQHVLDSGSRTDALANVPVQRLSIIDVFMCMQRHLVVRWRHVVPATAVIYAKLRAQFGYNEVVHQVLTSSISVCKVVHVPFYKFYNFCQEYVAPLLLTSGSNDTIVNVMRELKNSLKTSFEIIGKGGGDGFVNEGIDFVGIDWIGNDTSMPTSIIRSSRIQQQRKHGLQHIRQVDTPTSRSRLNQYSQYQSSSSTDNGTARVPGVWNLKNLYLHMSLLPPNNAQVVKWLFEEKVLGDGTLTPYDAFCSLYNTDQSNTTLWKRTKCPKDASGDDEQFCLNDDQTKRLVSHIMSSLLLAIIGHDRIVTALTDFADAGVIYQLVDGDKDQFFVTKSMMPIVLDQNSWWRMLDDMMNEAGHPTSEEIVTILPTAASPNTPYTMFFQPDDTKQAISCLRSMDGTLYQFPPYINLSTSIAEDSCSIPFDKGLEHFAETLLQASLSK